MATDLVLTIKTSQSNSAPTSLANGELAYSYLSDKLYLGTTADANSAPVVTYIGGKVLVDKVANLESLVIEAGGEAYHANLVITDTLRFDAGAYTSKGVMYVNELGIVDFINHASEGKVFQVSANGTPVFDDLSGGTF